MHILVPAFTATHESKHNQSVCDAGIVLIVILSRAPLSQAKNLDKHDGKEHEENQP